MEVAGYDIVEIVPSLDVANVTSPTPIASADQRHRGHQFGDKLDTCCGMLCSLKERLSMPRQEDRVMERRREFVLLVTQEQVSMRALRRRYGVLWGTAGPVERSEASSSHNLCGADEQFLAPHKPRGKTLPNNRREAEAANRQPTALPDAAQAV